jgi:hypothetical protein
VGGGEREREREREREENHNITIKRGKAIGSSTKFLWTPGLEPTCGCDVHPYFNVAPVLYPFPAMNCKFASTAIIKLWKLV